MFSCKPPLRRTPCSLWECSRFARLSICSFAHLHTNRRFVSFQHYQTPLFLRLTYHHSSTLSILGPNQTIHTTQSSYSLALAMAAYRCASGPCRKVGTLRCGSCKTTYYCSKVCQTAHWKRHKLTCDGPDAYSPLRPGVFNFLGMPRRLRDKVSHIFVSRPPT